MPVLVYLGPDTSMHSFKKRSCFLGAPAATDGWKAAGFEEVRLVRYAYWYLEPSTLTCHGYVLARAAVQFVVPERLLENHLLREVVSTISEGFDEFALGSYHGDIMWSMVREVPPLRIAHEVRIGVWIRAENGNGISTRRRLRILTASRGILLETTLDIIEVINQSVCYKSLDNSGCHVPAGLSERRNIEFGSETHFSNLVMSFISSDTEPGPTHARFLNQTDVSDGSPGADMFPRRVSLNHACLSSRSVLNMALIR